MKNLMIVTALITAGYSFADGQDIPKSEVPSVVLNAFESKFLDVKNVEWKRKGELYKVEFEVGSREHDVWIDKNGNIARHKEDFPKSELPAAIRDQISQDFKDYRIDDADKIETDGKIFYQVELDGKADDRKLLFSAEGQLTENNVDEDE